MHWYNEKKHFFNKFEYFAFWFLMIGILGISGDVLIFAFLKAFAPLDFLNSILSSENPIGNILNSILYVSLSIFIIWFVLSFFLPKNNEKKSS